MIGGTVAARMSPHLLADLARPMRTVIVTGTNGKSTTTRMLSEACAAAGLEVATNRGGDNMSEGVLAALMETPTADVAVLEVDEMHVRAVARQVRPDVLVFLNLSRDQLDRVGEIATIERRLRATVKEQPQAYVVANVDDPLMTSAAWDSAKPVWVAAGKGWSGDSLTAPRTGGAILYTSKQAAHSGNDTKVYWHSVPLDELKLAGGTTTAAPNEAGEAVAGLDAANPQDFYRPEPTWTWQGSDYTPGQTMRVSSPTGTLDVQINLPGRANRGNATQALAGAVALGVDPRKGALGIARVEAVAGRYARFDVGGKSVRLLLAKNPAGWQESLTMLDPKAALIVGVNGQRADGTDLSWLWDVDFDKLARARVWATGERGADLQVRLRYAGVDARYASTPLQGLQQVPAGRVDMLLNYTSFRDTRAELLRKGLLK
ncbi:UDP-N-acetylmuramyl peptide synthase [Actinomyces sp. HMSC06A08]|uniref:Lipid II isoglutaminyl synthase (glutamine-hydrolyzing) subunit MurT n=2 Tax=Winkia neuii TaxID=33007 RepID=A0A2I1IR15_9ACTO|nr:UDP-N-acetylmuramyl peptide synthase [Actinomyces sp. HMSC064C12]OFK01714.1 UDP-N-acetylmuramyl peptide synthase [Actinomyces sp. HMSC072A03]OFT54764.1 UDP-N-acetylmuramyl peptide synthase [Actinomyces sp. HMSC06A08]PKY73569.1 DUF1727 domain-containing protein [Winkia neuii]